MRQEFKGAILAIREAIIDDMITNGETRKIVFDAYNAYQENERDAVDYIFSTTNTDDLICCLKGGMTAKELAAIVSTRCEHFLFGANYQTPKVLYDHQVSEVLVSSLEDVLEDVLLYPNTGSAYEHLYETYVTNYIKGEE